MWGMKVFFVCAPRRVDCPTCGIRVERMPWSEGRYRLTETSAWFLAGWARRLSWKRVAEAFRTSWDHVFCSVEMAVARFSSFAGKYRPGPGSLTGVQAQSRRFWRWK
jgi:hypothetical protein